MKTWIFALPFLCAVHLALADDMPAAPATDQPQSAAAPVKAGPPHRMHKRAMKHMHHGNLPRGDLRACLKHKTNKAIIRCSETRHKR